jgi:alkylhydroperoxidase/carboxymuconolactone decarboxylase family protein YurZ
MKGGKQKMSYVPEIYQGFQQHFPEISRAYDELADKCQHAGPLDDKNRRLIKLGVAIGLSSRGSVMSHARRALREGINAAELRHAVLLSFTTIGFPTMMAAMNWVDEVIEKQQT